MMMREDPLISVIVPVYQVEDTLCACLDSVLNQTYRNLDVVLVNDGSTDGSLAICQEYADHDERIRIISRPNGGLSAARNTGLDAAMGEMILFVDSDDCISPCHVRSLLKTLVEDGCDIAVTGMTPFSRDIPEERISSDRHRYTAESAVEVIFYQGKFDTCAQAKLFRSELWEGQRFPEGYIHEDLPTIYQVFLRAKTVSFFSSTTYAYRYNPNGLNRSKTTHAKFRTAKLVKDAVRRVELENPALTRASKCFYVSFCFHLLLNADEESLPLDDREKLVSEIKALRRDVLLDGRARSKTRIACLLSYGGLGFVSRIFRLAEVLK